MAGGKDKVPVNKAEFLKPLNNLRSKAGYGGLSDDVLREAQMLIEYRSVDFRTSSLAYLNELTRGVERARAFGSGKDHEAVIQAMLAAAIDMRANSGMSGYQAVAGIGAKLIEFLGMISELNEDAIEVVLAFHAATQTVLAGSAPGAPTSNQEKLMEELDALCIRYFVRHPGNRRAL